MTIKQIEEADRYIPDARKQIHKEQRVIRRSQRGNTIGSAQDLIALLSALLANVERQRRALSVSQTLLHYRPLRPMTKRGAPGNPETGGGLVYLSRRVVLLALVGSLAPVGSRPLLCKATPVGDLIVVDRWILRIDDLKGMPTRVG